MAQIDIFDMFRMISPDQLISQYQDWILFFLLTFIFWGIITLTLRKFFGNTKAFRVLATSTALMFSVGTYYAIMIHKLNFSLAGLGMFGAMLILIILFYIMFGLNKSFNMNTRIALPLGLVLFYIALCRLTPNLMDNLQETFSFAKPTMAVFFFFSLFYLFKGFFVTMGKKKNPDLKETAKSLKSIQPPIQDQPDIDDEIKDDKKEDQLLKKKTIRLTKAEIKTIDDMENNLHHLISLVKEKGNTLDQDETYQISRILKQIWEKESLLIGAMPTLKKQADIYKQHHKKDISELEKRLKDSINNPQQQNQIREEIGYQKRMLETIEFIEAYETKIIQFTKNFNQNLQKAIEKLKSHYPRDCLEYLKIAKKELESMKHILKKQKELEKYAIRLNKKTIKDLKKEKTPR